MDTALALLQAENAGLRAQLAERDAALAVAAAQIEALSFNLAVLKRRQFGQSSEKLAAEIEQLELRLEDLEESRAEQGAKDPLAKPEQSVPAKSRKPALRKPLPPHLPRETVVHEPEIVCICQLELGELQDEGFDLALTGFDMAEIAGFLLDPTTGLTDPDEVPDLPETPVSRAGDVWTLGRHRLVCGDSTDAAVVATALNGVQPHFMVTDPPYGVDYDPAWRNRAGLSATARTGKVLNDHRADWREAWALFPGEVAYVWHGALHATTVAESLTSSGFEIRSQIIWAKERLVMGRGHYHWQHEPCWYAVRGTGHWSGDRKQTTLWQIPTRALADVGQQNAAEMEGRACHAIELSPGYVDVAIQRWQAFTGSLAHLEADGRHFADISAERLQGVAHAPAV